MQAVVVDDMTGATPKGSQYKENLRLHHHRLRTMGSKLQRGLSFNRVEPSLTFVNSARSHLVQVADVVSYNVYRHFVEHGDAWEDSLSTTLPTYSWFERLGPKFRSDTSGRIQGYGIVKAPMRKRVPGRTRKRRRPRLKTLGSSEGGPMDRGHLCPLMYAAFETNDSGQWRSPQPPGSVAESEGLCASLFSPAGFMAIAISTSKSTSGYHRKAVSACCITTYLQRQV